MSEFFKDIGKIAYEGKNSTNPLSFKYYNPDEMIAGKPMKEHLKFALSWWHTMGGDGTDMFGCGTADKSWGESDPSARAKAKVDAAFEIMDKLSIEYFCFHDRDLSPEYGSLAETNAKLDEVTDYIAEKMKADPTKKLLWGTAKCFDHPRYMHGAGTSPSADVFAFSAAQIKKAVEATVKLGGMGYVFWGGREGYETLLNTDMALEQDNMARLMRMTVDYARSIGYKGDFYIEPKPKEPTKHQYDFDTATVLGFLRKYGLENDFKMNIEANHATLAQHTFQHELRVARDNGVFGSIDANQGDPLLGWDTDQFPTNVYDAALCMYEVLKAGGFTNGGLNFDSKARRGSFTPEDIFLSYIAGMDTFALGLRIAVKMIEDGRIDKFVADRYASWQIGIGKDIIEGNVTMADLEKYALEKSEVTDSLSSGRQEMLESVVNNIMFNL
ncbi:xylose isomerase [Porcipelethomonas ammoniilytica]|jgi:xylose isomerase|uniref:xylose isomerase n=1 Tax=Porcipelethomonas ammoniilytica TaxID=2981722 RepID=UPI0008231148|nr:xylose isomerase [Porcipelethomonas ammoniilytica]MCU6720415.1 xylose isomerase [Porcipelethomonas ammoniilytica]SCJ12298.1 Xylose isomerase [uncultured Ruminococcus sp.]